MRKDSRAPRSAWKRISSGGVVLALTALFGLPTAAFAAPVTATVAGDPAIINVTADAAENEMFIGDSSTYVWIRDNNEGVAPGGGCALSPVDSEELRCPKPAGGVTVVNVILGGGDDTLLPVSLGEPLNVDGGAGDDDIFGGSLADTLIGGLGVDTTVYISTIDRTVTLDGAANDGAVGENDNVQTENVTTAGGADTLTGDAGANKLTAGAGVDTLNGGAGDDTLNGDAGPDALNGGANTDTVSYDPESRDVSVTAGAGGADDGVIDIDSGTPGNQSEGDNVNADVESIAGGGGDDILVGGTGAGTIRGNGGNDSLDGGNDTLSDVIVGNSGLDTVSYANRTADVFVTLDATANDGESGENDDVAGDIEAITGGSGDDTLTGNVGRNTLNGGAGADTLNGGDNDDTLRGGPDGDTLNGGGGAADLADYSAAAGNLTITVGGGGLDGEAGEGDTVNTSVENVTGGAFVDTITGDASKNRLNGGDGVDILNGGLGNDTLNGQGGDDTLQGADGNDVLNGGLGSDDINGGLGTGDTTSYATRTSAVRVNVDDADPGDDGEIDTDPVLAGDQGEDDNVRFNVEFVTGTSFADTIVGETGAAVTGPNIFNGGGGNDTLRGGDGNDTVNGGNGNDLVVGNLGRDGLNGGSGADHLVGAPDSLARDSINCGPGTDTNVHDTEDVVALSCE